MHIFPADRIRFVLDLDVGDLPQRNLALLRRIERRCIDQNVSNGIDGVARFVLQAQHQLEVAAAFQHARHRLAVQRDLDVFRHLADIDAITRGLVAIYLDGDLRHADLLLQVHVHRSGHGTSDGLRLQA